MCSNYKLNFFLELFWVIEIYIRIKDLPFCAVIHYFYTNIMDVLISNTNTMQAQLFKKKFIITVEYYILIRTFHDSQSPNKHSLVLASAPHVTEIFHTWARYERQLYQTCDFVSYQPSRKKFASLCGTCTFGPRTASFWLSLTEAATEH